MTSSPTVLQRSDRDYCVDVLPGVSRTFAATIPALPGRIRHSVLVAYLVCRIADTLEDSARLPASAKPYRLNQFATLLAEGSVDARPVEELFHPPEGDEEALAANASRVLRELARLPENHREAIRRCAITMCGGMARSIERRADPSAPLVQLCDTHDELERYCYFVAGTVGRLLTELFLERSERVGSQRDAMFELGDRFGRGLQMVNVLRDFGVDSRRGVRFIPEGPSPDGTNGANATALSGEALEAVLRAALEHLDAAVEYCTRLPRREFRVRFFCVVNLFLALRTLARVAERGEGSATGPVKIGRAAARRAAAWAFAFAPVNACIRWEASRHARRVRRSSSDSGVHVSAMREEPASADRDASAPVQAQDESPRASRSRC